MNPVKLISGYLLNFFQNHTRNLVLLFLLWAATQFILYQWWGITTSVDSEMFLQNAHHILRGVIPEGRDIWYLSYSLSLAVIMLIGIDAINGIILLQLFASAVALYALYKITFKISGDVIVSLLACLFYISWIKIHQWNFFVYTESLFTSCCVLTLSAILYAKKPVHFVLIGFLLFFTFLLRPTGWPFMLALMVWGLIEYRSTYFSFRWIWSVLFIVCLCGLNGASNDIYILESYTKGEIIYPAVTLGMEPPSGLLIPDSSEGTLWTILSFAVMNPIYFLKLTALKFLLFFGNVKPYFSAVHNVIIVIVLYPLYFFAIKGFFKMKTAVKYFITFFILFQAIIVSLTSENWDGRFLIPLLPFIFILSAVGLRSNNTVKSFI